MNDAVQVQPPTIHVVDDDEAVRTALRRVLDAYGYQAATYASAGEFLLAEPCGGPGCLLLDVHMPGPSGLQLQLALSQRKERLPVVMMTGFADIPMSVTAFKRGAVDFLTKPIDESLLIAAVERAMALSRERSEQAGREQAARSKLASLSPREREVFDELVRGCSNRQIGAALGICERTIKAHRASVLRKLGTHSTAELARTHLDAHATEAGWAW